MYFLVFLYYAWLTISALLILTILLVVLYQAYQASLRGSLAVAAAWVAVASIPFVLYAIDLKSTYTDETLREKEVAQLDRQPFPKDYPKVLEVHGYLSDKLILMYMGNLGLTRVYQFQSRANRTRGTDHVKRRAEVVSMVGSSFCHNYARNLLRKWRRNKNLGYTNQTDKKCLKRYRTVLNQEDSGLDAILFLMERQTTLHRPGKTWSSGSYEIRVRRGSQNILIDYWERPHITRPQSPFLIGLRGFIQKSEKPKKKSLNRVNFFLRNVNLT